MSYTQHEWQNDELITAAKMNNIEEGIAAGGSGALICHTDANNPDATPSGTLDKTFGEIYTALKNGIPVYVAAGMEA